MNTPIAKIEPPSNASLEIGGIGGNALRGLLQLLVKRAYLSLSVFAACLVLSASYLFVTQPVFRATTVLEIFRDTEDQSSNPAVERQAIAFVDNEFYETQFGLLRSEATALAVVRNLKLIHNPEFIEENPNRKSLTKQMIYELELQAVKKLQSNLDVVPARESRLVEIRYSDVNPRIAANIANGIAESFISSNFERRVERTEFARSFLTKQIDDLRVKFENQERALVEYAARRQILNLPASRSTSDGDGASQTAGQSLAGAELAALTDALAKARADRAIATGRLAALDRNGAGVSTEVLGNNAISALQQQRALVSATVANLSELYGDAYPPLMAKRSELETLENQLNELNQQVRSTVRADLQAAVTRENTLDIRVNDLKKQLVAVTRASVDYNILQREVDTTRQQYENMLQRLKQLSVANDVGASNVSVIQRARVPLEPYAPDVFQVIFIGIMLGTVLMVSSVLIAELLDTTISNPEVARRRFRETLLGIIPTSVDLDVFDVLSDPKSALNEAYVATLANLRFATAQGAPQVLSVTSTKPSEGKSTTAIALAMLFARQGERVVLVDADLRKPRLAKALDIPNETGVTNLLTGSNDFESVQQKSELLPGVSVITSGPTAPNPAELLSDQRLQVVIDNLKERFDRVVLDCPPVLGLADAPLLGNASDGCLFVVQAGRARYGESQRALDRLRALNTVVVGVLLTKFAARANRFDDYGYGYGTDKYYYYKEDN
jgi:succinoglycan biosynthesis transport protein ExoP